MRVSTRHEGDINKQLIPFSESGKTPITVILDHSANSIAVQHTAWMLANLAARLDGYVECISICCPENVPVHSHIFPFQSEGHDFGKALVSAVSSLEIVPVVSGKKVGIPFHIGPGAEVENGWRVYGDGWIGGITKFGIAKEPRSPLPFGPYTAACFAAAEIFKEMRLLPENYQSNEGFFDVWNLEPTRSFNSSGQAFLPSMELDFTLAGVGAVGTAFLHIMFACPTLTLSATLADNDDKGLDITNLNRYVLFGKSAIGKLKPDAVYELLKYPHIHFTPWNNAVETLPRIGSRVLSAVDKNISREAIQYLYPPRIISASTLDLRAEVLRCGPPGKGACLRCFNPPEVRHSDDEIVAKLQMMNADEFTKYCVEAGISIEEGEDWVKSKKCGQPGERLLGVLRGSDHPEGVFSVGFTSVFAGVLLASEFIKDCMGVANALNNSGNHFSFQFFNVLSSVNGVSFLSLDPNCPTCIPRNLSIWKKRFAELEPKR